MDLSPNDFIQALEDGGAFLRLRRHQVLVTNGLVLELLHLKEREKLSFKDLTTWLEGLSDKERSSLSSKAVTGKINRLKDKKKITVEDEERGRLEFALWNSV